MSQIQLTDPIFYKDGVPGQSTVVGFESGVTRVVRYTFTAPTTGATALTFQLDAISKGSGADIPIRFAISTDPDFYQNADADSPYTGTVTLELWNYTAQGEAQVRLAPNQTYYLWLFPGKNQWGWYYVSSSGTVTTSGVSQGVSAGDGVLGQPLSITVYSTPGATHRLTWQFENASGVIGEEIGDAVTWTPPLTLAASIPNSHTGICTITCYREGILLGSTTVNLSVPDSVAPQVSVTLGGTDLGVYLEKVSQLEVRVNTTLFYGAELTATAIAVDGKTYTGSGLTAGDHTVAVIVTDSRSLTTRWEHMINVLPYTVPQVELHASRCRVDGTLDDTGDHALVTVRGSVTQIAGNTAALTLTYGKTSLDIPVEVGVFETTTIIPADPNETLRIKARIEDAVKGTTRSMTLSTGYPTMEFFAGGKGIAFGKVADAEGFHCAMDAYFSGKVLDGQGRTLAARYDLTPVTGMYLTPIYGRVLELMGAGFLQLKFTCNRYLSAGDTLYTASLPIAEDLTVTDVTGKYSLTLTPTGITTPQSLSTGTYTFSCLLY